MGKLDSKFVMGMKFCLNDPGHITMIVTTPIYGKIPL